MFDPNAYIPIIASRKSPQLLDRDVDTLCTGFYGTINDVRGGLITYRTDGLLGPIDCDVIHYNKPESFLLAIPVAGFSDSRIVSLCYGAGVKGLALNDDNSRSPFRGKEFIASRAGQIASWLKVSSGSDEYGNYDIATAHFLVSVDPKTYEPLSIVMDFTIAFYRKLPFQHALRKLFDARRAWKKGRYGEMEDRMEDAVEDLSLLCPRWTEGLEAMLDESLESKRAQMPPLISERGLSELCGHAGMSKEEMCAIVARWSSRFGSRASFTCMALARGIFTAKVDFQNEHLQTAQWHPYGCRDLLPETAKEVLAQRGEVEISQANPADALRIAQSLVGVACQMDYSGTYEAALEQYRKLGEIDAVELPIP